MSMRYALLSVLLAASCAAPMHQRPAAATPAQLAQAGIVPVYARDAFPKYSNVDGSNGGWVEHQTYGYRAGTAVYVSPHTLLTSIAVMPKQNENGVTVIDLNDGIFVLDGAAPGRVYVTATHDVNAVSVLSTKKAGVPVALRDADVVTGEPLNIVSYDFTARRLGAYADATGRVRDAAVSRGPQDELLGLRPTFDLDVPAFEGELGAAVLDGAGQLVGITVYRSGTHLTALTVHAIREALATAGEGN